MGPASLGFEQRGPVNCCCQLRPSVFTEPCERLQAESLSLHHAAGKLPSDGTSPPGTDTLPLWSTQEVRGVLRRQSPDSQPLPNQTYLINSDKSAT